MKIKLKLLIAISATLLFCGPMLSYASSCVDGEIVSRPGRPAQSNGADTTQCGVLELEYGTERSWTSGSRGSAVAGGLRFGITSDLDFHWTAGDFLRLSAPDGDRSGYGDNWLGFSYRYLKQTEGRPSLGVIYMAKIPTGDPDQELGSGEVDHSLLFLASKNVRGVHVDFNVGPQWMGTPNSSSDHNVAFSMAASFPLAKRLTMVLESYGETRTNAETSAYASFMAGCSVQIHPRLYLDGGFDNGISSAAPGKRIFAGITVAVANLYRWAQPHSR